MYGFSFSAVSSTETPSAWKPRDAYLVWNSANHGISILHGSHHVAQKSSRITRPLKLESFTSFPFTSFNVKLRFAGFAFAGQAAPAAACAEKSQRSESLSVSSASASALIVAIAHRSFIDAIVPLSEAPPARPRRRAAPRLRAHARRARTCGRPRPRRRPRGPSRPPSRSAFRDARV